VLAICNTNSSTIPRESDAVIYTHAGPEIAVASTKALLTQIVAVYLIGLHLAQVRSALTDNQVADLYNEMLELPGKIEQILETVEPLRALTRKFADANTILFLGRNVGYPVALEGALKLKELAYIHAEGFAGGELKHGPIALIDAQSATPVIAILPAEPLFQPILATVPLQVFAYEIAVARGSDVDQPRNLAKSVTVE